MSARTKPIRILHVLQGMRRGGLETWVMNLMRRIDRRRFQFVFCTAIDEPCAYDAEIRSLGGRIIPCPWGRSISRFNERLGRVLRDDRYDVVHAHPYYFTGIVLRAARRAGVPCRLAHLHTTADGKRSTLSRRLYRRLMVHLVRRHATRVLSCSRISLQSFFGRNWHRDPRMMVVHYGINLAPFAGPTERDGVRRELALPPETPLIIHVGRFAKPKNHRGLIEIFRVLCEKRPDCHLLLVGDGELRSQIEAQIQTSGLQESVHMVGVRSDVARLMKASDVMLMPSIWEGMPLTFIEATAAGLPVVISDMPGMREANDICCRGTLLPKDLPAEQWARTVVETLHAPRPDPAEALERVRHSPFSSDTSARIMEEVYAEGARQ